MKTKDLVLDGLLVAVGVALGFLESLIPFPLPVPGAKYGFANLVTVYSLYELPLIQTVLILMARILISGFLFGSLSSLLYSLSGAVLSLLIMILLKRQVPLLLVSIFGGIFHNVGQLITACLVTGTWGLFYTYGFFLVLVGSLTGLTVGILSKLFLRASERIFHGLR